MPYFLLYGVFALWVLFDSINRKIGGVTALWVIGTALFGPIILPIYLADRPLKEGEVREGGRAWNILKNFAILWTVVMAIVFMVSVVSMGNLAAGLGGNTEMVGAGIGMVAGMAILAAIWFFPTAGAALLGFFLKKNTIVETGPTGSLAGETSQRSFAGGWGGLVGAAVLALIVVGLSTAWRGSSLKTTAPSTAVRSIQTSSTSDDHPLVDPAWDYDSTADQMGRGTTKTASLESVNSVDFEFPYNGGSKGEITLRNSPKYGKDVMFSVSKGQFMCNAEDCAVNVRVDQGRPIAVSGEDAADGSSTVIFLPYSIMPGYLEKAKVVRIEANFYNEGSRVFEFHPKGLDMGRLR